MIEEFIHSILRSSPELANYNGGGVYPLVAPKKAKGWVITYQQVGEPEALQAESAEQVRFQISIFPPEGYQASHYRSGKTAAKIVKSIMTEFRGIAGGVCIEQIRLSNQLDLNDPETERFYVLQDYLINYFEA